MKELARFTVDRLKEAKEVTGWDFVKNAWVSLDTKCACGMSQLLMAECDIKPERIKELAETGDLMNVIEEWLGVPRDYALGFMHGFDHGKENEYPPYCELNAIYAQGYEDGTNGRKEHIDAN